MRIGFFLCVAGTLVALSCATPEAQDTAPLGVAPQYDTTHIYVAADDFDAFVKSFVASFGGTTTPRGVFQVTPTPSQTMSQLVLSPVGSVSVFGFKTPIPYPFGAERTGYLVTDMDAAVRAARAQGADVVVAPFDDPIGKDAIVQWPGGVNMQLYWHTTKPNYPPLKTVPENRVYLSPERADAFVKSFVAFSQGKVVSDDRNAPGIGIGRPKETYRRILIESAFGKIAVHVSDGKLPYPYGREMTGYEVPAMGPALHAAIEAGAKVLEHPYNVGDREQAIVQFPGGYIAEIHAPVRK